MKPLKTYWYCRKYNTEKFTRILYIPKFRQEASTIFWKYQVWNAHQHSMCMCLIEIEQSLLPLIELHSPTTMPILGSFAQGKSVLFFCQLLAEKLKNVF